MICAVIIFPFIVIVFFTGNFLYSSLNPSWGDLVAMTPVRLSLSEVFSPWQNIYTGFYGSPNLPHIVLSQLLPIVSPTFLQFLFLFLVFPIFFMALFDFFFHIRKKNESVVWSLLYASLLTFILFFSNVFLVNYIQGNPDIYYAYALVLPAILYLYLLFRDRNLVTACKLALVITIACWFSQLAFYYFAIVLLPYFILFTIFERKYLRQVIPFLVTVLCLVVFNNLPLLYTTFTMITNAVSHVRVGGGPGGATDAFSLYSGINPLQLFFFAGNPGDYSWLLFNIPGGFVYSTNVFYSLLPLIVAVSLLTLTRSVSSGKKNDQRFVFSLFLLYLFWFTVLLIWDNPFIRDFLVNFPLTPLFRNPKKLLFTLYVSFLVFLVFQKLFINRNHYGLLLGIIALINISATLPLVLDGYAGVNKVTFHSVGKTGRDDDTVFRDTVGFPERFLSLKEILYSHDQLDSKKYYRIMVLPNNSQSLYQNLRYLFNPFFTNESYAIWGNLENPSTFMDILYQSTVDRTRNIGNLLKMTNIKYIVIDRKSPYYLYSDTGLPELRQYYGTYTTGDPETFDELLSTKPGLRKVYVNEDFYIYENLQYEDYRVYFSETPCQLSEYTEQRIEICDLVHGEAELFTNAPIAQVRHVTQKSPSEYELQIDVDKPGETVLFLDQTFNNHWQLKSSHPSLSVGKHFLANVFGNAWYISVSEPGVYTMNIIFSNAGVYALFVSISILSVLFTVSYILIYSAANNTVQKTINK